MDSFIVTPKLHPSTGTLPAFVKTSAFKAKTHANPDPQACGTATNQTAGPLATSFCHSFKH
jgi:hypothetical protein